MWISVRVILLSATQQLARNTAALLTVISLTLLVQTSAVVQTTEVVTSAETPLAAPRGPQDIHCE